MSDDLVKRLRSEMAGGYCNKRSLKQAAARIEALAAALEKADALAAQLDGRNVWMEKVHAAAHDYRAAREATK